MPYQPNIPTGSVPLNQDYLNLLGNFQSLDTGFGVDHVPFSVSNQNGYHTAIHFVPVSTGSPNIPPTGYTNTPGFGQLFTATTNDGIATDQTLFYNSGTGNNLTQMTMNFTPKRGANGSTFLPGRLIEQWGVVTVTGNVVSEPVLFASDPNNMDFPRFLYNVQLTTSVDIVGLISTVNVEFGSLSKTGFTITLKAINSVIAKQTIYWRALGT